MGKRFDDFVVKDLDVIGIFRTFEKDMVELMLEVMNVVMN